MQGRRLTILIAAVAVAACLITPISASAAGGYDKYLAPEGRCAYAQNRDGTVAQQERAMRCLILWARTKAGLRTLHANSKLGKSADLKARELLRCQVFAHAPCGHDTFRVFRQAGYAPSGAWQAGENIAWGTAQLGSPRAIMRAWLNSTGHRRNILKPEWKDQGVALRTGDFIGHSAAAIWVSHFGRRL